MGAYRQARPRSGRTADARGAGRGRFAGARALGALIAVVALLLALAPAAFAEAPTLFKTFNGSDVTNPETHASEPLGFSNSTHVAVDEATGDVYVTDEAKDAVDKFDSEGKYLSQITGASTKATTFGFGSKFDDIAVDNSGGANQGNVYVLTTNLGLLYAFAPNGSELWEAQGDGSWCGVGVDPSGNPWIGDDGTDTLTELSPTEGQPTGTSISTGARDCHMGFDSSGAVYTANRDGGVAKFDQSGNAVFSIDTASIPFSVGASFHQSSFFTVGTDSSKGNNPFIRQWDFSGKLISSIDGTAAADAWQGVAYNGASNRLYVTDYQAGNVQIYSVPPLPPTVTAEAPTNVTKTGATVNGKVNPNGTDVTDCHVLYESEAQFELDGKTFASAQSAPCSPAPPISGTSDVAVTASLGLLAPGTTYHTVIVASNGKTAEGSDTLVKTLPQPRPVVVTGSASSIGETGATLNGTANPEEGETTCVFQYGSSESYGLEAPCVANPGGGTSAVGVSATLAGLAPSATYHYRLVATNAGGTSYGADATFTTASPPPVEKPAEKPVEKPVEKPTEKPVEKPVVKKPLTRGQLLALAIKKCHKLPKHKRAACIKRAKKKYAPPKKHKKKK
jgi:hypothetical protein